MNLRAISMNNTQKERRTRVIFHLPLQNKEEAKAVEYVMSYLQSEYSRGRGVTGFTHSVERPPVFRGMWYDRTEDRWVPDSIVLFMVDSHFEIDDPGFEHYLDLLKREIQNAYSNYGSAQKEIWLVSHSIVRYV